MCATDFVNEATEVIVAPVQGAIISKPLAPPIQVKQVVLSSKASFHPLFWLIVLLPASSLGLVWFVADDLVIHGQEGFTMVTVVLWFTFLLFFGFLFVLPHKYEIMSDASINVVTFVAKKWKFYNVISVHDHQSYWSQARLQVLRFASDCDTCVLVKRRKGWDLLLSPKDPGEFVRTLWNVLSAQEEGDVSSLEDSLGSSSGPSPCPLM